MTDIASFLVGVAAGFALPVVIVGIPYIIWGPKILQDRRSRQ